MYIAVEVNKATGNPVNKKETTKKVIMEPC